MKNAKVKLYSCIALLLLAFSFLAPIAIAQGVKLEKDSLCNNQKYWFLQKMLTLPNGKVLMVHVNLNTGKSQIDEINGSRQLLTMSYAFDVCLKNNTLYVAGMDYDSIKSKNLFTFVEIDVNSYDIIYRISPDLPNPFLPSNILFDGDTVCVGGTMGQNLGWYNGGSPTSIRFDKEGNYQICQYTGIKCYYSSLIDSYNSSCMYYLRGSSLGGDCLIKVKAGDTLWVKRNIYSSNAQSQTLKTVRVNNKIFFYCQDIIPNDILCIDRLSGQCKKISFPGTVYDMLSGSDGALWVSGSQGTSMKIGSFSSEGVGLSMATFSDLWFANSGPVFTEKSNGSFFVIRNTANNENVGINAFTYISRTPDRPTNLSVNIDTTNLHVSFNWQKPILTGGKPVTSYVIEYKKDSISNWVTSISTNNSCTLKNLDPEKNYIFRVRAINEAGAGMPSEAVGITMPQSQSTGGIENISLDKFLIYPNPATPGEQITISGNYDAEVVVSDILGKEISRTTNNTFISLSSSGLYFVRIGNSAYSKKIVIR